MGPRQIGGGTASHRATLDGESDPPSSAWWLLPPPADEDDGEALSGGGDFLDSVFRPPDGDDWPADWGAAPLGIP